MKTFLNEGDQQEVLQRIGALRPDSPRRWGKMTCKQMICHLSDSFLLSLGEKPANQAKLPLPRAIFKLFALRAPMQWPKNIATVPELEQGVGGTAPAEFEKDRTALMAVIERFLNERPRRDHPIFGTMSESDWMRWGY